MSETIPPFTTEVLEQGYEPIVVVRKEVPWIDSRLQTLKNIHQETYDHTIRVGYLATKLGQFGDLPADSIAELTQASLMHDIGKLAVCRTILDKPGQLTPHEREQMKLHVIASGEEVKQYPRLRQIIMTHHEFQDDPYPREHYSPPEDPVVGFMQYLLALADGADAIMSERVYKPALPPKDAVELLRRRFSEDLVDFAVNTRAGIVI